MQIMREDLSHLIGRLVDVWGAKAFSNERTLAIWGYVEGLEYAIVKKAVDDFIANARQAPLPKDFRDALANARKGSRQYSLGDIQPKEMAKCWDCGDSGWVKLQRKETYGAWATFEKGSAACHCPRGRMIVEAAARMEKPTSLQQFSPNWETSYKIRPEYGDERHWSFE